MSKYKLVPVEPTEEMATAAMNEEIYANRFYGEPAAFSDIWNAMLAAAPAVQGEAVAWLITGPYEKAAFAYKETAEKYCAGLNRGYGEEAYKIRELYTAPQSQVKNDMTLFCDLKTDEEKSAFFLSGRGYETGVIAHSIQNDVAMAYHRCSEYRKELEALRDECEKLLKDAERYWWLRRGGNEDIGVVRGFDGIDCGSTSVAYTYEEGLRGNRLDEAIDAAMDG